MPEGVVLHAAPDVVDDLLGQPHGVEGVQHHRGFGQPSRQTALVATEL